MTSPQDPLDRSCFLVRTGRPHNPVIGERTETHSLPATANHLFTALLAGGKHPDTRAMLAALRQHRDDDPDSPKFGCLKWYMESPNVYDTNASFFVCTPLTGVWLACREQLDEDENAELRGVFSDVLPWFASMAAKPSFYYPNKCISDAAMLLAAGHVLEDEQVVANARDFALRYFDYYRRRGTGWGEDHSPAYTRVILEMTLLIMALEGAGRLYHEARRMTDAILDWAAFHGGLDAVPSIRGYNFPAKMEVRYGIDLLFGDKIEAAPGDLMALLKKLTGYQRDVVDQPVPRQRRWRTFDQHFSTTHIGEHARLGTLSEYPLMPNTYMHDGWGLGWQTKPCSFIVHNEDYGILEWISEDDDGIVRQHEAAGTIHDWASRHLFKRLSFHPDVLLASHQEGGAAIILREIHHLHSPTCRLIDRWRLAPGAGRVLVDGAVATPGTEIEPASWIVLEYKHCAVAIRALACRVPTEGSNDENPQRRTRGGIAELPVRVSADERGAYLAVELVSRSTGTLTEHLLFSGWCVVLLDRPEDVDSLQIDESFREDGELPRTYGELVRTVTLTTPAVALTIERDMLTWETRRHINGSPLEPQIG